MWLSAGAEPLTGGQDLEKPGKTGLVSPGSPLDDSTNAPPEAAKPSSGEFCLQDVSCSACLVADHACSAP